MSGAGRAPAGSAGVQPTEESPAGNLSDRWGVGGPSRAISVYSRRTHRATFSSCLKIPYSSLPKPARCFATIAGLCLRNSSPRAEWCHAVLNRHPAPQWQARNDLNPAGLTPANTHMRFTVKGTVPSRWPIICYFSTSKKNKTSGVSWHICLSQHSEGAFRLNKCFFHCPHGKICLFLVNYKRWG